MLGIFCQPFLLNVLEVILHVHVVPTYQCPDVTIGQVTAGASNQGDSCAMSTLSQSHTMHVGVGRQENSL